VRLAVFSHYYAAFFCCFTFAHLARWNAAIFLRTAAEIVRLGFTASTYKLKDGTEETSTQWYFERWPAASQD
jgi:hypothetical protein